MRLFQTIDDMFYTCVRTIIVAILAQTSAASFVARVTLSSFSSIQPNNMDKDFVTVTISSLEDCARLCYSTTSCNFGNYRIRGHVCYLNHVMGNSLSFTINTEKTPGFMTWTRSTLNTIFTEDNSPCSTCNSSQSCIVDYDQATCASYACGKPSNPNSFRIRGNIYTIGGKLTYGVCHNVTDVNVITCYVDGTWLGTQYECYVLSDGTRFALKVVHADVDQATALSLCQQEGADLATVFTLEKLDLLREVVGSSSTEDYWIDAQRVSGNEWSTSDGRNLSLSSDIWAEYTPNSDNNDDCARMRRSQNRKLDDIRCSAQYSYICEIEL